MVKIAGSDIPNLSKIVEETFDSIGNLYGGDSIEFDGYDADNDISMNSDLDDYIPDVSSDE
jgi:hypothetical protein